MPRRAGCFHSREKYFRDSFSFLPPPPLRGTSLSIRFFDEQGVAVNSHVPSQPILTVHRAACFVINVMRVDAPCFSSSFFFVVTPSWKIIFISFRWYWTRVCNLDTKPEKCKSFDTYVSKERTKRTWQRTRFQLLVRRLMKSRSIKFDTAPTILRALTIRWINANYRDGYSMLCVCVYSYSILGALSITRISMSRWRLSPWYSDCTKLAIKIVWN